MSKSERRLQRQEIGIAVESVHLKQDNALLRPLENDGRSIHQSEDRKYLELLAEPSLTPLMVTLLSRRLYAMFSMRWE